MAVGDIMLGDSPVCYGFGVHSMIARHGSDFPFAEVASTLKTADLVVGNLEAAASAFDPRKDGFRSIQYRAQPAAIEGLARAGFNVVSTATNHTMQHGRQAVEETVDLLDKAGIRYTGLEIREKSIFNPCSINIKGRRFGFLNYNLRPQQYFIDPPQWKEPDEQLMLSEISELKRSVDHVIVCMHWGDEFIEYPSPEQVRLGRAIIDAGASVILGHHPHILQGLERYKSGVIAYSLGNFVFDLWQAKLRRSMILKLDFDGSSTTAIEIIPVMINRHHQPEVLTGGEGTEAVKYIDGLAEMVTDDMSKLDSYREMVEDNTRQYRRDVNWYYLTHIHRYNPRLFFGNLLNSLRRRMGHK